MEGLLVRNECVYFFIIVKSIRKGIYRKRDKLN